MPQISSSESPSAYPRASCPAVTKLSEPLAMLLRPREDRERDVGEGGADLVERRHDDLERPVVEPERRGAELRGDDDRVDLRGAVGDEAGDDEHDEQHGRRRELLDHERPVPGAEERRDHGTAEGQRGRDDVGHGERSKPQRAHELRPVLRRDPVHDE
ncbi:hypothetical protein EVAR_72150_1, partial [Eumeta japonica]